MVYICCVWYIYMTYVWCTCIVCRACVQEPGVCVMMFPVSVVCVFVCDIFVLCVWILCDVCGVCVVFIMCVCGVCLECGL